MSRISPPHVLESSSFASSAAWTLRRMPFSWASLRKLRRCSAVTLSAAHPRPLGPPSGKNSKASNRCSTANPKGSESGAKKAVWLPMRKRPSSVIVKSHLRSGLKHEEAPVGISTFDVLRSAEHLFDCKAHFCHTLDHALAEIFVPQQVFIFIVQHNLSRLRQHHAVVEAGARETRQVLGARIRTKNQTLPEQAEGLTRKGSDVRRAVTALVAPAEGAAGAVADQGFAQAKHDLAYQIVAIARYFIRQKTAYEIGQ